MNTATLKKRLNIYELYLSRNNEKLELATHLLNQSKGRLQEISFKIADVNSKIAATSAEVGSKTLSTTLQSRYCYGESLSNLLIELEQEHEIIKAEVQRRTAELKVFQGKKVGIEVVIEKCKQQMVLLANEAESKVMDEWAITSFAKTNRGK